MYQTPHYNYYFKATKIDWVLVTGFPARGADVVYKTVAEITKHILNIHATSTRDIPGSPDWFSSPRCRRGTEQSLGSQNTHRNTRATPTRGFPYCRTEAMMCFKICSHSHQPFPKARLIERSGSYECFSRFMV